MRKGTCVGHVVNPEREYRLLRQQMDHNVSGVPETPTILKILKLLYSPEEAELARQLPTRPVALPELARRVGMPEDELRDKMTDLARRGLALDVEKKGQCYYALPPVLGGIFEFVFMRPRDDFPMEELARLFDEYMNREEAFSLAAYAGETQFARAFVHEEAVLEGDHTEILDWERVSKIIETASCISIALCPCRHKNGHLGKACDAPQRTCISLNGGAEMMIHSGISERIDAREALRIVDECKSAGLAQCGDNVKRGVTFICNCCGCCCTMVQAIRTFNLGHAIVSSNWIAEGDSRECTGCGRCAGACPAAAIAMQDGSGRRYPLLDESLCLGCGVCSTTCKSGAIRMKARDRRVFTPETAFDKTVRMAIERGNLADLLFEDPERHSHRALARILRILEKTPPWKAAMAVKPLRSAFLNAMLKRQ